LREYLWAQKEFLSKAVLIAANALLDVVVGAAIAIPYFYFHPGAESSGGWWSVNHYLARILVAVA